MKTLKPSQVLQMVMMGLLLALTGLTLNGCSKKKSANGAPGGPNGNYGINSGYSTAGCPIPANASALHQTLGNGETLTIYLVRINSNQVQLSGDLVIPASSLSNALNSCLAAVTFNTHTNSGSAYEDITSGGTLNGTNVSIQIIPYGSGPYPTYLEGKYMLGQIIINAPYANYNYYTATLTGI